MSNAAFKAGGEITLKEFTVGRGGEFRAHYGLPPINCNDPTFVRTADNPTVNAQSVPFSQSHISTFQLKPEKTVLNLTRVEWAYLFPNPTADGKTEVNFSDASKFSEIMITDMLGKTVQHLPVEGSKIKIDLSENPKGVYFVKIIGKENIIVKKIIYQ